MFVQAECRLCRRLWLREAVDAEAVEEDNFVDHIYHGKELFHNFHVRWKIRSVVLYITGEQDEKHSQKQRLVL